MSITADSLLPRPKLDCDVGYDAAVKGTSVVVKMKPIVHVETPPRYAPGQQVSTAHGVGFTAQCLYQPKASV